MPAESGSNRLDRIERAIELLIDDHVQFREEHKQFLTAQVVLTDRVDRLAQTMVALAEAQKATAEQLRATDEQLKATDERLGALIGIVDDIIRKRPAQ